MKIAGLILVKIGVKKPIKVVIIPHSSAWKAAANGVVATISQITAECENRIYARYFTSNNWLGYHVNRWITVSQYTILKDSL